MSDLGSSLVVFLLLAFYFIHPLLPYSFLKIGLSTCTVSQLSIANQVRDKGGLDEGVP